MSLENNTSTKKFEEALQLLNEAAREKKQEIQQLFGDKYTHIRQAVEDAAAQQGERLNRVRQATGEAIEFGGERAKQVAAELDEKVKENPWAYIGGAAVGALLLGFILGASRNNK